MAERNTAEKKKKPDSGVVVDISADAAGGKGKKGKKPKKKKSKLGLMITVFILVLALAATGYVIFRNDFWGVRTAVFTFVHNLDPEYKELTEWEATLTTKEETLTLREQEVDTAQTDLDAYSTELDEREKYLADLEASRVPVYRPPINEDDVVYMQNIGKIYAAMEAKNAADIMVRLYSIEDMAAIIYYMEQTSAAAVLEQMKAEIAADITDQLLRY